MSVLSSADSACSTPLRWQPAAPGTVLREAVKIGNANLPKDHFLVALAHGALGECLTTQKRFAEAEPLLLDSYQTLKNSQGIDNPRTQIARQRLVALYEASGRVDKAEQYRRDVGSR